MSDKSSSVIILDSGKRGPIVTIIGGVHGNEQCGIRAIDYLKTLKLTNGRVYLITGNPKAIHNKVRYTELDLNRSFCPDEDFSRKEKLTYEYRCSRKIIPYLKKSNILLDIHSSATKKSVPFVICEEKDSLLASCLPFSTFCYGFKKIHNGSTDNFMNIMGKVGIAIECGYSNDHMAANIATQSAKSLLEQLGMIKLLKNKKTINKKLQIFRILKSYKTQTSHFRLAKDFADFEKIKKGQDIAKDGDVIIRSNKDQFILFARNHNAINRQGFIYVSKGSLAKKNKELVSC